MNKRTFSSHLLFAVLAGFMLLSVTASKVSAAASRTVTKVEAKKDSGSAESGFQTLELSAGPTVTYDPGDEIRVRITADVDSGPWESTGVKISNSLGSTFFCYGGEQEHPALGSGDDQMVNFVIPKNQIPPGFSGGSPNKNLYVKTYGSDNCDDGDWTQGGTMGNPFPNGLIFQNAFVVTPIAHPDGFFTQVNGTLVGNIFDNDAKNASIDSSPITYSLVNSDTIDGGEWVGPGSLEFDPSGNGGFTYTPDLDFKGSVNFEYLVNFYGLVSSGDPIKQTQPVTVTLVVGDSQNLIDSGILEPSDPGQLDAVDSLEALVDITVEVPVADTISIILIPAGTVISNAQAGHSLDATQLTKSTPEINTLSGLGQETVVNGVLQWGIPGTTLAFDPAIEIKLYVGTDLNGQVLSIRRSPSGTGDWVSEGIVNPSCTVVDGYCVFRATQASYYIAMQTTHEPNKPSTGSGSSGSSSAPQDHSCSEKAPVGFPDLFQINTTGSEATLFLAPLSSGVDKYQVMYGTQPGVDQYGATFDQGPSEGVVSFTIGHLNPNTLYYFRVSAGKSCAFGNWSNEMEVRTNSRGSVSVVKYYKGGIMTAVKKPSSPTSTSVSPTPTNEAPAQPSPAPQAESQQVEQPTQPAQSNQNQGFWGWVKSLFGR